MVAGPGPGLLALALALWPAGLWAQPRLQEAGGGQRAPGDSVTLSCRGSGFTFEDYYIFWFRQAPGGSPEWVSFISSPMGTLEDYGAAVKDRAKMSRDNSRSEAYLSLRPLQAQDSARYFCAVPRGQEMQMRFNTNLPARGYLTFCAGCSPMAPAWLLPNSSCPSESTLSSLGSPQTPPPQCHDQTICEHLQAQRLQEVPEQPVPVFGHSHTVKKHFSLMFSENLL